MSLKDFLVILIIIAGYRKKFIIMDNSFFTLNADCLLIIKFYQGCALLTTIVVNQSKIRLIVSRLTKFFLIDYMINRADSINLRVSGNVIDVLVFLIPNIIL